MYLISEEEYNLRGPLGVTLPTYKTPDEKAEERDFKSLGTYENKAKQLYDIVLKHSRVNDKNEWYEKRDDTLPVVGTNIIDLITYAIKASGGKPYGWHVFLEFLKRNKAIPRSLLIKAVRDSLVDKITTVPLGGATTDYVDDDEPSKEQKLEPPNEPIKLSVMKSKLPILHKQRIPRAKSSSLILKDQSGKGLKRYF